MYGLEIPEDERRLFYEQVWKIVRQVPSGKVITYGKVADYIPPPAGVPGEDYRSNRARWVGYAMAACPKDVPWQRVINAQGKISTRKGAEEQRRLLEAEGVVFDAHGKIDLARYGWAGPEASWLRDNDLNTPDQPQQLSLL